MDRDRTAADRFQSVTGRLESFADLRPSVADHVRWIKDGCRSTEDHLVSIPDLLAFK
jgi:hypothetical protein